MMPGILGDILRRLSESENEKTKCGQPHRIPKAGDVSTNAERDVETERQQRVCPQAANRRGGL